MLSNILLILGVALLSLSLRTFNHPLLGKLSVLGVLATSYLTGFLLTGSWLGGVLCTLSWLFLPWFELLTSVRRLKLPTDQLLSPRRAPDEEQFPTLPELSEELEAEGFVQTDDCGWKWNNHEQFFRLFNKPDERLQGAICFIEETAVAYFYVSLCSRGSDGRVWLTWNYPFPYSLKLPKNWQVNRLRGEVSVAELYERHRAFLEANAVQTDALEALEPEQIPEKIQDDLRAQIGANLSAGLLFKDPKGSARYTWRGLLFIWVEFLRDLVRFS